MNVFRVIVIIWLVISAVRFLWAIISRIRGAMIKQKAKDAGVPLSPALVAMGTIMNSRVLAWSLGSTIIATIILVVIR